MPAQKLPMPTPPSTLETSTLIPHGILRNLRLGHFKRCEDLARRVPIAIGAGFPEHADPPSLRGLAEPHQIAVACCAVVDLHQPLEGPATIRRLVDGEVLADRERWTRGQHDLPAAQAQQAPLARGIRHARLLVPTVGPGTWHIPGRKALTAVDTAHHMSATAGNTQVLDAERHQHFVSNLLHYALRRPRHRVHLTAQPPSLALVVRVDNAA
eukprot:CAMPEP_0183407156 /NCGR_PEP_ID=MMETSP0370-20130417/17151_1 /TAXON_ID=268820 /ORGANISM="Peridinium aciculiferum, Strain PAER-2" /LENGTH=211 /DNA_ID=CAMNT_0025589477 /DNA_START=32 /DNA_END=663 /DNA_ORIENTATION=+